MRLSTSFNREAYFQNRSWQGASRSSWIIKFWLLRSCWIFSPPKNAVSTGTDGSRMGPSLDCMASKTGVPSRIPRFRAEWFSRCEGERCLEETVLDVSTLWGRSTWSIRLRCCAYSSTVTFWSGSRASKGTSPLLFHHTQSITLSQWKSGFGVDFAYSPRLSHCLFCLCYQSKSTFHQTW